MRVLVADDCVVVRHNVASMIRALPEVDHVAEVDSGQDAIEAIRRHCPHVVILDIQMARGSGIDALREIAAGHPDLPVIMLTNHTDPIYRSACLQAGARHFFDKTLEFERVMVAVSEISREVNAQSTAR